MRLNLYVIIIFSMDYRSTRGTIHAEGEPMKLADTFDYGGGIVNGNRAADPGLVYDMGTADYTQYLCNMGYKN